MKINNRLVVVNSVEPRNISIGSFQFIRLMCITGEIIEYKPTCAIVQGMRNSILPPFIDITPSVIQVEGKSKLILSFLILITNTVVISPKTVIGGLQPVNVDKTVFDQIEDKIFPDTLDKVNTNTDITGKQCLILKLVFSNQASHRSC